MSVDWRNKQAILRDLALVQGNVPVRNVVTVASDDKPPSLHVDEETEEHFMQQYIAGGNPSITPDFSPLKEMLEKVRDISINEIESPELVKDEPETPGKGTKGEVVKCKHYRNAAVESLLSLDHVKDYQYKSSAVIEKKKNKVIPVVLPPENMFKAKTNKSVDITKSMANSSIGPIKVSGPGVFVPSSDALDYYNKVMEKKRQKELAEENIWTRAERQMKEIEAKRKQTIVMS